MISIKAKPIKLAPFLLLIFTAISYSCNEAPTDEQSVKATKGDSLFQEGMQLYAGNRYQEALSCFVRAKEVASQSADTLLLARSLEQMASVSLATGDDHLALSYYYQSLPLFEKCGDKEGIAKVYNIIGLYKSAQKEYDTAKAYYMRAIRLNQQINNRTGIIHNKGNLGYLYEKTDEFEQAKSLYLDLVDSLVKWEDKQNLPVIYYNLSSLYQKLRLADSAIHYLQLAIDISESTCDTSLLTALYGDYGKMLIEKQGYDSAYYYLNKSISYARAIGDARNELASFKLLLGLDTLTGNYIEAASQFWKVLSLKDSIYKRNLKNNLENSELRYENQKKDNQIILQQLQIETAKKQKRNFLYLFLLTFLSVGLLLVMFFLILRNKKKRQILHDKQMMIKDLEIESAAKSQEIDKMRIQKIEEEIKIKEREQMSNALALEQKNELLGMINSKIVEAMKDSGSLKIKELNGIVASIKAQVAGSDESDLFNQKFSQLNITFYPNLKKAHPDLTKSELKFCAFLKVNLSGSQIAKIQNITSEAIRKTRYRVRKKMGLSPEVSLEDYISRF
jgi:tetratricopeptide (TPR) repeat protein/DNA-binding CsgD family transcriptional regulator